jgi:hypothetical protein
MEKITSTPKPELSDDSTPISRPPRASTEDSELSEPETEADTVPGAVKCQFSITTRSGRVVKPLLPIITGIKKERKAEVASEFSTKIEPSPRYQALLRESEYAQSPEDIAKIETKLWNVRHRYKPEGSSSPHALNLERLRSLVDKRRGSRAQDAKGNVEGEGKKKNAKNNDNKATLDPDGDRGLDEAEHSESVGPQEMGHNLMGTTPFRNPLELLWADIEIARIAAIRLRYPEVFDRAVSKFEVRNGLVDRTLGETTARIIDNIRMFATPPKNRPQEVMYSLLEGLVLPKSEPEDDTEMGPPLNTEPAMELAAGRRARVLGRMKELHPIIKGQSRKTLTQQIEGTSLIAERMAKPTATEKPEETSHAAGRRTKLSTVSNAESPKSIPSRTSRVWSSTRLRAKRSPETTKPNEDGPPVKRLAPMRGRNNKAKDAKTNTRAADKLSRSVRGGQTGARGASAASSISTECSTLSTQRGDRHNSQRRGTRNPSPVVSDLYPNGTRRFAAWDSSPPPFTREEYAGSNTQRALSGYALTQMDQADASFNISTTQANTGTHPGTACSGYPYLQTHSNTGKNYDHSNVDTRSYQIGIMPLASMAPMTVEVMQTAHVGQNLAPIVQAEPISPIIPPAAPVAAIAQMIPRSMQATPPLTQEFAPFSPMQLLTTPAVAPEAPVEQVSLLSMPVPLAIQVAQDWLPAVTDNVPT